MLDRLMSKDIREYKDNMELEENSLEIKENKEILPIEAAREEIQDGQEEG